MNDFELLFILQKSFEIQFPVFYDSIVIVEKSNDFIDAK